MLQRERESGAAAAEELALSRNFNLQGLRSRFAIAIRSLRQRRRSSVSLMAAYAPLADMASVLTPPHALPRLPSLSYRPAHLRARAQAHPHVPRRRALLWGQMAEGGSHTGHEVCADVARWAHLQRVGDVWAAAGSGSGAQRVAAVAGAGSGGSAQRQRTAGTRKIIEVDRHLP